MIVSQRWKAERDSAPIGTLGCPKKERALHVQMCAKAFFEFSQCSLRQKTNFFLFSCLLFYEWAIGNLCVCSPASACMGHCVWVMICLACHRWIDMAEGLHGGLHIYRVDLTRALPFLFWINKSVFFIQLLLALLELIIAYPFWIQGAAGMFSFGPLPQLSISTPPKWLIVEGGSGYEKRKKCFNHVHSSGDI